MRIQLLILTLLISASFCHAHGPGFEYLEATEQSATNDDYLVGEFNPSTGRVIYRTSDFAVEIGEFGVYAN